MPSIRKPGQRISDSSYVYFFDVRGRRTRNEREKNELYSVLSLLILITFETCKSFSLILKLKHVNTQIKVCFSLEFNQRHAKFLFNFVLSHSLCRSLSVSTNKQPIFYVCNLFAKKKKKNIYLSFPTRFLYNFYYLILLLLSSCLLLLLFHTYAEPVILNVDGNNDAFLFLFYWQ